MEARLDKWLWAARIFKTRSIAADACKNGRITIAGVKQKASKMIKEGDIIEIQMGAKPVKVKVLVVSEHATKADAAQMYTVVE